MAWYKVVVHDERSTEAEPSVSLFGGGTLTCGFSDEGWTDSEGRITLEHSARSLDVYVDSRKLRRDVGPGVVVVTA